MIWEMAIAIALAGFCGLGRSVIPTFLPESDFIYNYNEQKINVGSKKKICVHGTSNPAILRLQGA